MKMVKKFDGKAKTYELWEVEEIKTEKDCLKALARIAGIGKLGGFGFYGYEDMDEHGNEVSFDTVEELKDNLDEIEKIGADTASVYVFIDGKGVEISFNPFWDNEKGTQMRISGEEDAVKKAIQKIKPIIEKG